MVNYRDPWVEKMMETTLGMPLESATARTRSLRERQADTLAALDSFMEQEEYEHRETMRVLRRSLTEDRPGQRKVFGDGDSSD